MIERASSCVEPVSHLLLRRLEPPVRSRRILGPSFWRNGADELTVPHWWPLYLEDIRGRTRGQGKVESGISSIKSRHPSQKAKYGANRSLSLTSNAPSCPHPRAKSSRVYGKSMRYVSRDITESRRLNTNALVATLDSEVDGQVQGFPDSRRKGIIATTSKHSSNDNASEEASVNRNSLDEHEHGHLRSASLTPLTKLDPEFADGTSNAAVNNDIESELRRYLDSGILSEAELKDSRNFEEVRALFKRLPDQETYAAEVFHFMSESTEQQHLKVALRAFKLIPLEKRRAKDYERAARTAIQRNDYRQAISINAEATSRQLNRECSTFLLLHTASHQLWSAAAQIWSASYEPLTRNRQRLSTTPMGRLLLKHAKKYQNLPLAISSLAREILDRRAVVMHQAGVLLHLGRELLHLLVKSGRLMRLMDPATLVSTLESYRELQLVNPTVHLDAINTLLKFVRKPDSGRSAALVYHHLREKFPHFQPPPSLYGSILSILSEEGAPSEVYVYYLRQFAQLHGTADKKSYQKVLTALAAQGDVDGLQRVFLDLCSVHGRPTDVAYFTPLIYAYARLGDVAAAEREFERLTDWGVKPTIYCWNILLYAHARSSEPEKAFEIFEKMKAEGVSPDVYTFGTLMGIVAKTGDVSSVLDIIEQAQQHQIKGSYDMISGLVHSYCLNDQADVAERLAEATSRANLEGKPVKMWNYLLRHYAFEADSEGVLRVQQRMNALGVKPDDMTYAALMVALVVIGKTRDAAQILASLNASSTLAPTPFHYSIVLQGYVQEGNGKAAENVYQEMVRTFPRTSPSSRLAMLHLRSLRNPEQGRPLKDASDYLGEILHGLTEQDRATKQPQPGFGRRTPVQALPFVYVEFMAGILASRGEVGQADTLLRRYESLSRSSYLDTEPNIPESISFLTTRLIILTHRRDWQQVDKTWRQILDRAVKLASPYSTPRRRQHTDDGISTILRSPSESTKGIDLISGPDFSFSSMIPKSDMPTTDSPINRSGFKVLFPQRYILEAPITRYLRALEIQNLQQTAVKLVEKLERVGFSLTSKNWNFYIQMLTRSSDPKHWVQAFETFEEKFLPNTPPWRHLRAGKWSRPSTSKGGALEIFRRKTLEKLDRGHLMPTYVTAVHLAAILLESNRRAARGDASINVNLFRSAPGAYRFIRRIPRSKDRIQGGVLRGRNILGDLQKRSPRRTSPNETKTEDKGRESLSDSIGKLIDDQIIKTPDVGYKWLPLPASTKEAKRKEDVPPVNGALYNPDDRRLEKRAEAEQRRREERSSLLDDATRHRKSGTFSPRKLGVVVPKPSVHRRGRGRSDSGGIPAAPKKAEVSAGKEQAADNERGK